MKQLKYFFVIILLTTVIQPSYAHRYFNSVIGRWTTPDPMQQKYPGWSPYNYAFDNPVRFIDPNGDSVSVITSAPTIRNTPNASSTPFSLVGHTAINVDGQVYSFQGDGKWYVIKYDNYVGNEKQVRTVVEQTVNVDQSKVQSDLDSKKDIASQYNKETNSCVTNTMSALKAGGIPFNTPNGIVTPEQLSNTLQNSGYVTFSQGTVSLSGSSMAGMIIYKAAFLLINSGFINGGLNTAPLLPEPGK